MYGRKIQVQQVQHTTSRFLLASKLYLFKKLEVEKRKKNILKKEDISQTFLREFGGFHGYSVNVAEETQTLC